MAKLHVVGAGPAGSIAALSALRNGDDVVVSEDHPVAGLPENCSGLFSLDGLESLRRFVDYRRHVLNQIRGADIFFDGSVFSVRRKSPVACVCDRTGLDQSLAANAELEGARINYGERVNGHYHADDIIGADGPLSHVALSHSFPKIRKYASTLQAQIPFRCRDPHAVEMFLSNSRFPGFFAWVIPHDEYTAEFGVGVEQPHRVQDAWQRLLRLKGVPSAPRPRGAVIPLEARSKTALRIGRRTVLLAGDAAGQVKSTTGGGVIFGGNCAALAGKYHSQPLRYELEWRTRYGVDLAFHGLLHGYLATRRDDELSAVGTRLKKMNFDVYLSNHGHMDRPTRMIRPALVAHMVRNIMGVA
jgi:digeranylgeranylglycerophospholipid reductase